MAEFTPHEAPAHDARSLPVMMPAQKLIGRERTLAHIFSQLKAATPVLLYGAAGIGKTAIAASMAAAYSEMPAGALWFDVANAPLNELIARVGRAYKDHDIANVETPAVNITAAGLLLTREKPLIVLDGTAHNVAALNEFVTRAAVGLPVLIVADEEIASPNWRSLRIARLEPDQAAALFRQMADLKTGNADDAAIAELVTALNFVPFALGVAAGAVKSSNGTVTPASFLASLPSMQGAAVNPQLQALTAAFRTLPNALQGILLVMGATHTGAATASLLATVANAPVETLNAAMLQLLDRALIERDHRYGEPFYRVHPLIFTFASTWLRGSGRLEALQQRVADSLLAYARRHSATETGTGTTHHDRLAAEMDNFVATAQALATSGNRDFAAQITAALMNAGDFVNQRGYVYELLSMRRLAAQSTSAFPAHSTTPTQRPPEVMQSATDNEDELIDDDLIDDELIDDEEDTGYIPSALMDNDDDEDDDLPLDDDDDPEADVIGFDDAPAPSQPPLFVSVAPTMTPRPLTAEPLDEMTRLRTALMSARQSTDRRKQAETLMQIGTLQERDATDTEAVPTYSEALTLYEGLNDQPGMLAALDRLAALTSRMDNAQAALLHATRGAQIADLLRDTLRQMRLLTIVGDERQTLGESEAAIRAYTGALEIAEASDDARNAALLRFKLGYAYLDDGQPEAAITVWEEALTRFRQQERRDYEGRVLGGLGTANAELNRWAEAINFHKSALHIAREVANGSTTDADEETLQLTSLGYAHVRAHEAGQAAADGTNHLGQAVLRYRQALHLAYTGGSRENIVSTTVDLARLLAESPKHMGIAEMLIDSALLIDPHDRDLRKWKDRITADRTRLGDAAAPIMQGSARDYAENAYRLLENG